MYNELFIHLGDFVIEYVGEVIDQEEFLYRLKAKQDAQDESYYFLTLDQTRVIDAGPRGNLARFMNHSCQPNCETQKWTVLGDTRVGLFAVEDIPAETELTFNYYLECAQDVVDDTTAKTRQQPCHCGAPNCSGFIGAKATKANNKNRIAGSGEEPQNGKGSKRGKKRKASRRAVDRQQAEDSCFRCTEGGRVIMCDVKTCSKVYHLECLNLTTTPKGTNINYRVSSSTNAISCLYFKENGNVLGTTATFAVAVQAFFAPFVQIHSARPTATSLALKAILSWVLSATSILRKT